MVRRKRDKSWIRPNKNARRRQDFITRTGDIGIRHFRNDKGTGAEMCPAIVSGMVTGDALLSPRSLSKVNSPQFPSCL